MLLGLALSAQAQQPIVFHGVPSNATVNCLSDLPGGLLTALDAVPYGVPMDALSTNDTFYLQIWPLGSGPGGSWGLLDACGILTGTLSRIEAIVNGCQISVGTVVGVATGFLGVQQGFEERYADGKTIIVLPVVTDYPDGNHNVTILGLIVCQMLDSGSGVGSGWQLQVRLLSAPSSLPNVTATSTCTGVVNVAFSEARTNVASNCSTVILRTWTATDACSNSASATQTITVSNTLPLSISCPANVIVRADAGQCTASHVKLGLAVAIDNCSVSQPASSNAPDLFPLGINQVIWTAGCAACTQTVAVVDTTNFGIKSISQQSNDVLLAWTMPMGLTGLVQAVTGDDVGGFSNLFTDIGTPFFVPGTGVLATNYFDVGAVTNASRFYRVRLVP
jgi:hypothetical protein